jgi:hypothetical protein
MSRQVNATQHACMALLAEGVATYAQLGKAAGVTPDGARRACRYLLTLKPSLAMYYHSGGGHGNTDVLQLTDAGRAAWAAGLEVVERRGNGEQS